MELESRIIGRVHVFIDPDIWDWPGHRDEIIGKMIELSTLIVCLESGKTELVPFKEVGTSEKRL